MENKEKLLTLSPEYYENKQNMDSIKKLVDVDNSVIKDIMLELDMPEVTVGELVAKRIVTTKESFNEDKLIKLLENSADKDDVALGPKFIKYKPYVDMDALEDAMYKNLIPEDVIVKMNNCREVKEVVQLRVTKKKVKKNDD